jgi:hypothetical protein
MNILEKISEEFDTSNLTKEQKSLVNYAQTRLDDGDKISIYEDYSGRCMCGQTCMGVVIGRDSGGCEKKIDGRYPRTDNMGLDTIYYWPGVPGLKYKPPTKDEE